MKKSLADQLKSKADQLATMGMEVDQTTRLDQWQTDPESVPRMYRAQVKGRCSLHDASKGNQDLDWWAREWTFPNEKGEAKYQRSCPPLGQQGAIYRVEVEFPFRVFSNGGQDSIARPMIGKDGIPFLPGSSVKGLFLRACTTEQAAKYCGREVRQQGKMQHLPGTAPLRFHGAYPVGNWANRIVDLVHPQGNRQIGTDPLKTTKNRKEQEESASASALISLYQPQLVFEFSCPPQQFEQINWREVESILIGAMQLGVGGKTSSGYGLGGNIPGKPPIRPNTRLSFKLEGKGVSPTLRDGTPEFRPNLFKAALRGHTRRLLAGVAQGTTVDDVVHRWFGHTKSAATIQLIWQERRVAQFADINRPDLNPTYNVEGILYADFQPRSVRQQDERDIALLQKIFEFAYVMGGFGKSWRRVWHETFMPNYHKSNFAIGCHWLSSEVDEIQTSKHLREFLTRLHTQCCAYLGVDEHKTQAANWRESWHPNRVAVFCRTGMNSTAVALFHDDTFKTTPAIGGRNPNDERPKFVSSVWHRMLPLKNGTEYLEIVTVFHGDRTPWVDQLQHFVQAVKNAGLKHTWGTEPTP